MVRGNCRRWSVSTLSYVGTESGHDHPGVISHLFSNFPVPKRSCAHFHGEVPRTHDGYLPQVAPVPTVDASYAYATSAIELTDPLLLNTNTYIELSSICASVSTSKTFGLVFDSAHFHQADNACIQFHGKAAGFRALP